MKADLGELYSSHYRHVFSLCRYLLNSLDAAEDATHEVFLRAQRGIDGYVRALPFSTWLLSIAGHYCVDILRRRSTELRLFGPEQSEWCEPAAARVSPLAELLAAECGAKVRMAIAALPVKYRVPLVLAYYNELTYDEIAAVLGLNRNHVATLIFRGKKELGRILAPENQQEKKSELSLRIDVFDVRRW